MEDNDEREEIRDEKEDEEQEVRDADADTSDVEEKQESDTADITRRLNALGEAVANLTKMLTTFIKNGAASVSDPEPEPEGIASDGEPVKTEFEELEI